MSTIAIIGAGAVGLSSAALLRSRGHDVHMWSALEEETEALRISGGVTCEGSLSGNYSVSASTSAQTCVEGADVVMIAAPAFAHRALISAVAPFVNERQYLVMHSATAMTSLMLAQQLANRRVQATIVDLSTSVCTSRKSGPTSVKVAPLKPGVDVATLPAARVGLGTAMMEGLFGPLFAGQKNLLAISINNHNAVYHVPAFVFNLAAVENGVAWNIWSNMTPVVARYIERIDNERLAVARAYGVSGIPVGDYVRRSIGVEGESLADVFAAAAAKRPNPTGPQSLDDRYLTEDVPYGLAFFVALGKAAGIAMPLTEQLLAFMSVVFERDFAADGSRLDLLGIAGLSPNAIVKVATDGFLGN